MRATASQELIDLLARLELATAADLRRASRRARRLAGELTHFDSVWVDALVQAEKLTPYQAAELNASRGAGLRVGPYALLAPQGSPAWARAFDACTVDPGVTQHVRLVTIADLRDASGAADALSQTIRKLASCAIPQLATITACGADGETLWAASRPIAGRLAAEWLVHSGRMPPAVVLEVARQMAIALLALERAGAPHGDISTCNLVLDPIGLAQLTWPGLRSAVRPVETEGAADWPAEAYDHLAPERMRGAPASAAADLYSCGIVWRHLLSGRSPFALVRTAGKLCAAQTQQLEPIAHLAPDTPPALVAAITACESRDLSKRPASAAALVELLGPSTDQGQALVAQYLSRGATQSARLARRIRTIRRSSQLPTWCAVAAGVVFALAVATSPWWGGRLMSGGPELADAPPQIAQSKSANGKSASPSSSTEERPQTNKIAAESPLKPTPNSPEISPRAMARETPSPGSAAKRTADPANRVTPASATQPITSRLAPSSTLPSAPATAQRATPRTVSKEFLLAAARPTAWSSVQPQAGQTVKGRAEERPTVVIPVSGAQLSVEGVRFEQVDFVSPVGDPAAGLRVTARNVSFVDCTFGGAALDESEAVSLDWAPRAADGSPAAPAELQVTGGSFYSAASAIRCTILDEARVTLADVLHLGSGSLVCVENSPQQKSIPAAPASLALRMMHCTSRGAESLLEVVAPATAGQTPRVRVEAIECAFAIASDGTLLLVRGGAGPADALRQVAWTGQGSVVAPGARPVAWQAAGEPRPVADNRLAIEGLVRSELGFAGEPDAGRDASQLVRWQVPLRSLDPPGIIEASARSSRKPLRSRDISPSGRGAGAWD